MISRSIVVVHLCQRVQSSQISILISHSVYLFTCQQATPAWAWKLVEVALWNNKILNLLSRLGALSWLPPRLSLHMFNAADILQSVHDLSLYDYQPPLLSPSLLQVWSRLWDVLPRLWQRQDSGGIGVQGEKVSQSGLHDPRSQQRAGDQGGEGIMTCLHRMHIFTPQDTFTGWV